jgi:LacI family transcriptional regulator
MATIKDVAQRAGVSTASVSRVLSGDERTSPALRERVRAAARELSYRPNAVARSLRSTGTRTIGLVVSDLLNPFFAELTRAVEDAARAAGYAVIVGNADEDPEQQDHYVRILLGRQVDGLIVVPTVETSPLLREAAADDHNIVLVDRPAADVDAPIARVDGAAAVTELVDHLVATGRRRLAIIAGPDHAGTSRERLDAYLAAVARHGLDLPAAWTIHGDFRVDSGHAGLASLLDGADVPDAVLIANGPMALGGLELLAERADATPAIPADLALAVFDDMPWFTLLRPQLTAIRQPTVELGTRALEMLLARINGEPVPDVHLPAHLILRESTEPRSKR